MLTGVRAAYLAGAGRSVLVLERGVALGGAVRSAVLDAADDQGTPLPATGLIFQLYRALQTSGHGELGNHALIKALEQLIATERG